MWTKYWANDENRKNLSKINKQLDLVAKAIPVVDDSKICFYCGNKAYFWFKTNDKYCCKDRIERCKEVRKQISERFTIENKELARQRCFNNFKNPEYLKKFQDALHAKPNKPEILLIKLFNDLNLQYKYTGDFSLWIDGKNPDFINHDKKKIIEHFGTYYHGENMTGIGNPTHEENRISHFKKNGYDCLIIWENELKDISILSYKILQFDNQ